MVGLVGLYLATASRSLRLPNEYSIGHWLQSYTYGFIKRGLPGTALRPILDLKGPHEIIDIINVVAVVVFVLFSGALLAATATTLRPGRLLLAAAAAVVFLGSPFVVFSAHIVGYFDQLTAIAAIACVYFTTRRWWVAAGLLSTAAILAHEMYIMTGMPMVLLCAWLRLWGDDASTRWRALLALLLGPALASMAVVASSFLQNDELLTALRQEIAARHLIDAETVNVTTYHLQHSFAGYFAEERGWGLKRLTDDALNSVVLPALVPLLLGASALLFQTRRAGWIPVYVALALSPWLMHWVAWDMGRIAVLPLFAAYLGFFGFCSLPEPARGRQELPRWCAPAFVAASAVVALANGRADVPLMDDTFDGEGAFSLRASQLQNYRCKRMLFENSDFERGTLAGWSATGEAFSHQPIEGDPQELGRIPGRQGQHWVGSYDRRPDSPADEAVQGDEPQGSLSSPLFQIAGDRIIFLVGGGDDASLLSVTLEVEGEEVQRTTGEDWERMRTFVWGTVDHRGRDARIVINDASSSAWGHINADGFCYPD